MNLIETFQPSLRGRADRPALWFRDQWYTFGELDRQSDAVAHALVNDCGIRRGDRVSMFLGNCPELIVFYLAGLKTGAIVVPINVLYRDRELTRLLTDAEPRVLLCDPQRFEVLAPLRHRFDALEQIFVTGAETPAATRGFGELTEAAPDMPVSVAGISGDDPALMIYTSGTTGRSKGALLTHHNLVSNIVTLLHCWQWTAADRFLLALPMFHMHGLGNGLHGALASGCTTFLLPRFHADIATELLTREKCTLFFGVPTMYERLLEHADAGDAVPSDMRLYVSGSAPLSPDTFARFKTVFGHEILERYGMSETAMITSNLYAGPRVQGSVGKPLPGVSVRIVDQAGVAVADDETGEIQLRGPNVLKEYWRQPEKTAETFQDGWFRTGDLGRYDAQGNIIICGRAKELIITGGFNVYPQEIINCLVDHAGVVEAAVIGVPDQRRGELPKAYVVAADPVPTEAELTAYCMTQLASFKVPKRIVFLDALPRNAMGKLQLQNLPERDCL